MVEVGCPAFVPLIEAGDLEAPELRAAAASYLEPMLEQGAEAIVLGCTHYPLLVPLLQSLLPPDVRLVDPALAAVARLGPLLASLGDVPEGEQNPHPTPHPLQQCRICVTGCADSFAQAAARWLGDTPPVERVNLLAPSAQRSAAGGF